MAFVRRLMVIGARLLLLIRVVAVSAARPELHPAAVSADCLGVDLHEIAAQQSVQVLQDCVGQLQKYAQQTREQQKRSQEANKLYAGDIVAASSVLSSLQATQRAHQRVFSSFRRDQREELGQVLQDLRKRPHSAVEGRSQPELASRELPLSELQGERQGVEEPEAVGVPEGLAMASLPDEQQQEDDSISMAPPAEMQPQFQIPPKLEHVAPRGTGALTGFIEAETEAAAARAMENGATKSLGPVVPRGILTEQVPDVVGDSPVRGASPVPLDGFAVIEEGK